jgi:hypothetical protein
MSEEKKDHEPWIPKLDKQPLFTNSADYERGLGEASDPLDITDEEPEDEEEEKGSPLAPDAFKPGR